jgi:RimJ/RimL family protein N-acetyltransferase
MTSDYTITTPRLRLDAPSLAEVTALRRGDHAPLAKRLAATIPDDWWLGPTLLRLLPDLPEMMAREPGDTRWIWLIIEPITARVIGDLGYHGPVRDQATVEIGYSVVPGVRGFGYVPEAAAALIQWTFAHYPPVTQIIAQIDPANTASRRVAAKLGMQPLPPRSADLLCFGLSRPPT